MKHIYDGLFSRLPKELGVKINPQDRKKLNSAIYNFLLVAFPQIFPKFYFNLLYRLLGLSEEKISEEKISEESANFSTEIAFNNLDALVQEYKDALAYLDKLRKSQQSKTDLEAKKVKLEEEIRILEEEKDILSLEVGTYKPGREIDLEREASLDLGWVEGRINELRSEFIEVALALRPNSLKEEIFSQLQALVQGRQQKYCDESTPFNERLLDLQQFLAKLFHSGALDVIKSLLVGDDRDYFFQTRNNYESALGGKDSIQFGLEYVFAAVIKLLRPLKGDPGFIKNPILYILAAFHLVYGYLDGDSLIKYSQEEQYFFERVKGFYSFQGLYSDFANLSEFLEGKILGCFQGAFSKEKAKELRTIFGKVGRPDLSGVIFTNQEEDGTFKRSEFLKSGNHHVVLKILATENGIPSAVLKLFFLVESLSCEQFKEINFTEKQVTSWRKFFETQGARDLLALLKLAYSPQRTEFSILSAHDFNLGPVFSDSRGQEEKRLAHNSSFSSLCSTDLSSASDSSGSDSELSSVCSEMSVVASTPSLTEMRFNYIYNLCISFIEKFFFTAMPLLYDCRDSINNFDELLGLLNLIKKFKSDDIQELNLRATQVFRCADAWATLFQSNSHERKLLDIEISDFLDALPSDALVKLGHS